LLSAAYSPSCGTGFTSDHELTYLNIIAVAARIVRPVPKAGDVGHVRFKKLNALPNADRVSATDFFALKG
jgi:hypothetical protein